MVFQGDTKPIQIGGDTDTDVMELNLSVRTKGQRRDRSTMERKAAVLEAYLASGMQQRPFCDAMPQPRIDHTLLSRWLKQQVSIQFTRPPPPPPSSSPR